MYLEPITEKFVEFNVHHIAPSANNEGTVKVPDFEFP